MPVSGVKEREKVCKCYAVGFEDGGRVKAKESGGL